MKKFALIAIIGGMTTAGLAGYAIAQPGHHGGKGAMMMQKLDTNGDGQITRAEAEAFKADRFAAADANGDGGVSMDEMEAFREAEREARKERKKQAMFSRADKDGNGVISTDEFESRGAPMFDRIDANDDGVVSADELEAMKGKRGKFGHRHHGGKSDN